MGQTRRGKGKKSYASPLAKTYKNDQMQAMCANFQENVIACAFCTSPLHQGPRGKRETKSCFLEPEGAGKA
jgi:hypothetical protein